MDKRKLFALILLTFVIGIACGWFVRKYTFKNRNNNVMIRDDSGFKYTRPLLYDDLPKENSPLLREINQKLDSYIDDAQEKGLAKDVSVYVNIPSISDWTAINPDIKYSPASLLKVPLMMVYLNKGEYRSSILATEYKFEGKDANTNTHYKPKKEMELGKSYSVNDLINRMITYSDNNAENILASQLTESDFNRIFDLIKIKRLDYDHQEDSMNVKTYSYFFRVMYNSTFLSRQISEHALTLLASTTFKNGISAGVPKNTSVAHKFGERYFSNKSEVQLHDCGIVYFPANSYILCVMTRGDDFKNLEEVIKNISKITYDTNLEESKSSTSEN